MVVPPRDDGETQATGHRGWEKFGESVVPSPISPADILSPAIRLTPRSDSAGVISARCDVLG